MSQAIVLFGRLGSLIGALATVLPPLALLALGDAAAAADAPPADKLESLKRDIARVRADDAALQQKAAAHALELQTLKERLVAVAATARRLDRQVEAGDEALARLLAEEDATRRALAGRRAELTRLLGALQRLARRPPAVIVASAHPPLETIRGGLLMRAAVPTLEGDARRLATDLARLAALERRIAAEREERDRALAALAAERRSLVGLIEERSALAQRDRQASLAAEARAERLAAEARDIEQLLARVARAEKGTALRPGDLATPPVAVALAPAPARVEPAGSLLPVAGRITQRFGERLAGGGDAQGLTIATRPSAEVLAPRSGEVVFAGPFRGYGRLLIIRHGDGYHALLAGMERLDAEVGDHVLAGEPVGAMGAGPGSGSQLYIELRHSGRPINPLPWLAANSNKVSG